MNDYFGPLPRQYCAYFYILSIIFGFSFVLSLVSLGIYVVVNFKKLNTMFIVNSIFVLFNTFLIYFVNRLLHTICIKSI